MKRASRRYVVRPRLVRVLQRRQAHPLTALVDQPPRPAAEDLCGPDGFGAEQTDPAVRVEAVGLDDLDSLTGVDRTAAMRAFGVDGLHATGERQRLAPAARAGTRRPGERRNPADGGRHIAHLTEADRAREREAGVAQGFAWALLEQSADGV